MYNFESRQKMCIRNCNFYIYTSLKLKKKLTKNCTDPRNAAVIYRYTWRVHRVNHNQYFPGNVLNLNLLVCSEAGLKIKNLIYSTKITLKNVQKFNQNFQNFEKYSEKLKKFCNIFRKSMQYV